MPLEAAKQAWNWALHWDKVNGNLPYDYFRKANRMLLLENSLRRGVSVFAIAFSLAFPARQAICDDLFPDKNLEAVVRREVFEKRYNNDPLTAEDVKNISQVVGKGKGIKSLEGLQNCKALMKIDLAKNELVDLAPIKELQLLQSIDLSPNKIESLEPMVGLIKSQYLQLSGNSITDLTPLKEMSNLRNLYIAENKVKSVEPVSALKRLVSLDLSGNPIEDASPIGKLTGLKSISLKGSGIKNLEFVRTLTPDFLMLNGNAIGDFGPLVESCEADAKGDRRFAQFLRLYLDEASLKDAAQGTAIERLKSAKVKINPSN